ncbi:MAG: D-glycerate dehydrogenase [Planctomycetaceae bacterium]|nr:D-glycerate dehydrogenase [Planctomycetaceae bacterium]
MKPLILSDPLPPLFAQLTADRFDVRPIGTLPDDPAQVLGLFSYGHFAIDGRLMDAYPQLKVISNHGVGVDHIDVQAAADRGVPVGNTPGCLDEATADHTMALLLATARNVVSGDRFARGPGFQNYDPGILLGTEVSGQTIGIVGMGRIGTEVARRAAAFGMRILYHNRSPRPEVERALGATWVAFDPLLSDSDFVVLNCPLTDATTGLIGRTQLQQMKSSAILINMARGGVVITDELCDALAAGEIRAAGLDVTEPEPLPRDHRLLSLENVVLTPHLGSATVQTRHRMMKRAVDNLSAGIKGIALPYPVIP